MKNNFSNKKVAILGFGVEGKSVASFLHKHGADITVLDEASKQGFDQKEIQEYKRKGIKIIFGKIPNLSSFDYIFRSPGVPLNHKSLKKIPSEKITSATKLFFELCPCPIIGVTGTKGKGTTATLIYQMLKESGKQAYLGGNIGAPILDFLEKLAPSDKVVLELSSFQLQDLHKSPHIAVLLMITSEHLDYHKDVLEYVQAKRNILASQSETDFVILNRDYIASRESDVHANGKVFQVSRFDEVSDGVFIKDNAIWARLNGVESKITETKDIRLPGGHNLENAMAAIMVALLSGIKKKSIVKVLKTFKGLEHRLEQVRVVKGVLYIDDSFSTTPETAMAAIESYAQPLILILGGSGKNSDFKQLGRLISQKDNIKVIIGIGKEWKRIKSKIRNPKFEIIENCKNMKQIVKKAAEIATDGDVVILTPACASFDMFQNYKDRGDQFKNEVNALTSHRS